jgi:DNA-directed RNA polymerase specialized sigma24 family protein
MKISKFVKVFNSIRPSESVDLWAAVSWRDRTANLEDAETWLRREVERRGARVGHVTRFVGPRYAHNLPRELRDAARRAKRKGRKLVAFAFDRFSRHPRFHPTRRPNLQANRLGDLIDLRSHTRGVELVTFVDPDASPEEVKAWRTKLGHWAKGNKGGRPRNYQARADEDDLAICEALLIYGFSYGQIAKRVGRSKATIQSWANRIKGAV